ncbi:MAG: M20/M25/M40 family metallo-hydrolase, partial [Chloroflexi bacterium]|nr:M20/M25/M40 family metallo-hydrolase [Chloroflexota bacterium]
VTVHPGSAPAYRIDSAHPGLQVARRVLHEQYGQPPLDVFIGGTLPIAEIFKRTLDIDTVFFSFSTADEDFHAPNEFFRASRLWEGLSAWTRYWQGAGLDNE